MRVVTVGRIGAWDATPFGNDHANDWAYDLEGVDDLSLIRAAFAEINDGYIESDDGTVVVAAAEVLTWLVGRPGERNAYTEKVAAWTQAHPLEVDAVLVEQALAALERVTSSDSELAELWDGQPDWLASVQDVRDRLRPPG